VGIDLSDEQRRNSDQGYAYQTWLGSRSGGGRKESGFSPIWYLLEGDWAVVAQRAAQRRRGGGQGGERPRPRDFYGFGRARR
jgi:hypothetical protein